MPSQVILLGIKNQTAGDFYMDLVENNEIGELDKTAWPTGSVYTFCDGSARLLQYRSTDTMSVAPVSGGYYTDWLWLMNKSNPVN